MTKDPSNRPVWLGRLSLNKDDYSIVREKDSEGLMRTHIVPKDDNLAIFTFTGRLTDLQAFEALEFARHCHIAGKGEGYYDGLAEKLETIGKEFIREMKGMNDEQMEAIIREVRARRKDLELE